MKIIAVCGMGIGTSLLLKMNADKALDQLGVTGDVVAADLGTAKKTGNDADLVLTSAELAPELDEVSTPVVVINNFLDLDEVTAAIRNAHQTAH